MYIELENSEKLTAKAYIKTIALKILTILSITIGIIIVELVFGYIYEGLSSTDYSAVFFSGNKGDPRAVTGIQGYFESYDNGKLTIKVCNINDINVELISIHDADEKNSYTFTDDKIIKPNTGKLEFKTFVFENVDSEFLKDKTNIYIKYSYDDFNERLVALIPYKLFNDEAYFSTDIRTQDNKSEFDFIVEDETSVYFEGNNIIIEKPMYLPAGKNLRLLAGQTIELTNGAYIVSYSAIQALGEKETSIHIISHDTTGKGIFVSSAKDKSNLRNVIFDGLGAPQSGIWALTGAVTFYKSDVDINNCEFRNNNSEDGLNIIDSNFNIQDCIFQNTFADAFDSDFCNGSINNCIFEDTGNDALDISTTQLKANNLAFNNIGDKGISCGENSNLDIKNINISKAQIGLASKDLSIINGNQVNIDNSIIAITLYQKKIEFGPSTINISDVNLTGDIDLDYLIEENSNLFIDNKKIPAKMASKENLLFEKIINGEKLG